MEIICIFVDFLISILPLLPLSLFRSVYFQNISQNSFRDRRVNVYLKTN